MPPRITALVLCIAAQTVAFPAFADVKSPPPAPTHPIAATAGATPVAVHAAKTGGGELIKSAAAGTRDDAPAPRAAAHPPGHDDHPRRGGTAMLLAALALMSGIALRRFGNSGQ